MNKLFLKDLQLGGKRVLLRVDFNVPLDADGCVTDTTRIDAALPTIRYLLEQGASIVLMSHLGRPRGEFNPDYSLKPVAAELAALLKHPVKMAPAVFGHETEQLVHTLQPNEILLLENLRFHRAEEHPDEDPDFAKTLASYGDVYVNDAFGTAHRKHASTYALPKLFPKAAAAGFLLEKEIHYLSEALDNPKRPFIALIGGAKVSTKIGVLKALLKKVDRLLIGGGMSYTFLMAKGISVGKSICEPDLVSVAKEILESSVPIELPIDIVAAEACSENAPHETVLASSGIPDDLEGVDIGPKTIERYNKLIQESKTLLWNGPVGVFELKPFDTGTRAIAETIANSDLISIVGGGDSIAALKETGLADTITHLSTGGGATLEYIEYGTLPAIEALSDAN